MKATISCAILIALIACLPAGAQVSTAELVGVVTDSSGAAIPNAKVVVTNAETKFTREAQTDVTGNYIITLIPPGTYSIASEAPGFSRLVQSGITLQINQRARVDLSLQIGQVSDTVEVAASAPLLESQSSSLGAVINQQFVADLPLNGRNFVQLAILSPGVTGTGYSTTGTIMSGTRPDDRRPGTEIFSNGNREGSNNFLYDGIDNNDRLTLSIVLRPGVDAIREFKVQTNLNSADVGRNSGAVVDVVTKSGTNDVHGSVFEFLRNSATDARSYYQAKGTAFPPYRYNQFGFSLGGPILIPKVYNGRNKTFFFVDYEGFRRTSLSTLTTTIPTLAMRQGDFGSTNIFDPLTTRTASTSSGYIRDPFPANVIPSSRWDPITKIMVNAYPQPQNSAAFSNYFSNLTQKQNWDQGDIRIDHQFSPSNTFFARYAIQHTTTIVPNTFTTPVQLPGLSSPITLGNEDSFAGTSFAPVQHAVADWVHVFSPRLINDVRIGFNRFVLDYTAEGYAPNANLGNKLGVPNSNTQPYQQLLPIFSPANYTGDGASRSLPIFRRENTFHYVDNVTFTKGLHTLKFGGDIRRRQITEWQTNRGNGRFNFSTGFTAQPGVGGTGHSIASELLGYPTLIEQDFVLAWTGQRGIESGLYFADDYRISRKLTLNLGLRWEYFSPYSEVANRLGNFDAATATVKVAGRNGVGATDNVGRDWRDFAPRFGFAYQATSKTVIRGGYGLFFNPNGSGQVLLRLFRHMPYGPIYSVSPGDINVGTRVSDGFPAAPTVNFDSLNNPTGGVIGVVPNFKASYAQQFNLTVEREITPMNLLIKAAYVGNLGRRLGTNFDLNQPIPGPTSVASRRPYYNLRPGLSSITYQTSDGLSNYNAFQVTADKRMSKGLSLLFSYCWSHAIADVGTEFGGGTTTPQDIRNRRADRSNSDFDTRHRATISYTYALPLKFSSRALNLAIGDWQTNGLVSLQSGLPFTPTLASPTVNTGGGSRPDRAANGTLSSSDRTLSRWFDKTAFTTPAPYTYGNAGRNILFGPGRVNFDLSLFKDFPIKERLKARLQIEGFNVFNTPQFGLPNASIGAAQAGVISSVVGNPRQMQFSLKLQF